MVPSTKTKTDIADLLKNVGAKRLDYKVVVTPGGSADVVFFRVDEEKAIEAEKEIDAIYEFVMNRVHHLTRPI